MHNIDKPMGKQNRYGVHYVPFHLNCHMKVAMAMN